VGDGAFYNNQITSITIPSSITEMGKKVFESRLTKKSSQPAVDYVDDKGAILYTTANNFDTYYSSTGNKSGRYTYTREDGWKLAE
jgi:hypothetical protein